MARMDISDYAKSSAGKQMILEEGRFCCGARLWQGFRGVAVSVNERQLTDDELDDIMDVDDTVQIVWGQRRQRMEGRNSAKISEYDKRRGELRDTRNKIREAIRSDKAEKLPVSEDDLEEMRQLDERMKKLNLGRAALSFDKARKRESGVTRASEATPVSEILGQCTVCEAVPPPGTPKGAETKWLRGHTMGKHKAKKAAAG